MSLGGKYVFSTFMCLVLPMCIMTSCSYVVCVCFMFVKVMSSLISPPPCLCSLSVCGWCSGVFLVF